MTRSSRWRRRLTVCLLPILALLAVAGVSALVIRFAPPWLVSTKGLTEPPAGWPDAHTDEPDEQHQ